MDGKTRKQIIDVFDKSVELQKALEEVREYEEGNYRELSVNRSGSDAYYTSEEVLSNLNKACEAMDSLKECLKLASEY